MFSNFKKVLAVVAMACSVGISVNDANALRASDNNSALEYVCCPYGIAAYLRGSGVESWECARLKVLPDNTLRVKLFCNGRRETIALPSLESFSNSSIIDFAGKKLIFDNLSVSMDDEKLVDCSFCINCEGQVCKFEFSTLTKKISISKDGELLRSFQLHEEWQSKYNQVIGLGLSLVSGILIGEVI